MWSIDEDEEADWYVKSPDGHRFYFGNIEGISKCCFDNARFIVEACNEKENKNGNQDNQNHKKEQ